MPLSSFSIMFSKGLIPRVIESLVCMVTVLDKILDFSKLKVFADEFILKCDYNDEICDFGMYAKHFANKLN